jgi:TRAP-type C4-dicarboxylate transport system permease small subunit
MFTPVLAVIGALLIFFGAFLLGLWCGWMWWGRHLSQDVRARREQLMDWAVVALFVLVLALIFLGLLALFEGYLPGATR